MRNKSSKRSKCAASHAPTTIALGVTLISPPRQQHQLTLGQSLWIRDDAQDAQLLRGLPVHRRLQNSLQDCPETDFGLRCLC